MFCDPMPERSGTENQRATRARLAGPTTGAEPPARILYSFTDESGQRGFSPGASDCFVLASVFYEQQREGQVHDFLDQLRVDLGRQRGQPLKWSNLRSHHERLHAVKRVAGTEFLHVTAVVVCKRAFAPEARLMDEDRAYLYTYRFLLERLSWAARARRAQLRYTLAHIRRFKAEKLHDYETRLFEWGTQIDWDWVQARAHIGHPEQQQCLQLADLAASAIAAAFNADRYGNTECRYLRELLPALRRGPGRNPRKLTSYGLKIHPNTAAQALFPWVLDL